MRGTILFTAGLIGLSGIASAQVLTTAPANNGAGGIYLELTALNEALFINEFATPFSGTIGDTAQVEVYWRTGSYGAFINDPGAWDLLGTFSAVMAGPTTNSAITLESPFLIDQGITTSFYLHGVSGGNIRYTGTGQAPPQTTWANDDLELFSDVARTGFTAFAGTAFEPRTFSGTVSYQPIPEPMTLGALALGGLLLARRRRRNL